MQPVYAGPSIASVAVSLLFPDKLMERQMRTLSRNWMQLLSLASLLCLLSACGNSVTRNHSAGDAEATRGAIANADGSYSYLYRIVNARTHAAVANTGVNLTDYTHPAYTRQWSISTNADG